jgi:hypothetical protein
MIVPPRVFDSYAEYKAWFTGEYETFTLPMNVVECGPFIGPTFAPDLPPWKLNWWLIFQEDNHVISCSEYFEGVRKRPAAGQKSQFSYHYGLHSNKTDSRGCPKHSTRVDTLLRIDLAPHYADHIHFEGVDHIPQTSLTGNLIILDTTMFGFINRVLQHRLTRKPLNQCFEFEVS